jgi:hypothetical protein
MIRQRIKAGLKRAVAQGVKLGRPKVDSAIECTVRKLAKGLGILKVAKSLGIGTGTVQRISKEFVTARSTPRVGGYEQRRGPPVDATGRGSAPVSRMALMTDQRWPEPVSRLRLRVGSIVVAEPGRGAILRQLCPSPQR